MNKNKKRKTFFFTLLGITITCIIVTSSYIIPKLLLQSNIKNSENKLEIAPESYYIAYESSLAQDL